MERKCDNRSPDPESALGHGVNPTHWILGFFLATLIIWSISYLFGDTLLLHTWSPETGSWIRPPGSIHRHRSEGWGTSRFGELDVIGVEEVSKSEAPAIAIWGDSYVEAFQVEQWERMQEVLMGMWRADGIKSLTAFGIGKSGESVADYFFKIPRYEKQCPAIIAHFIVLSSLSDVLPDQSSSENAAFQSKPEYRIIEGNKKPEHMRIKAVLRKCGFDFVWLPTRSLIKDTKLRFCLGPPKAGLRSTEVSHEPNTEKAFSFLLHALRHQSTKPIIFVYCPPLPAITGGEVHFKDHNADAVSVFARECRLNEIGFIDMTHDFCNYYGETGTFPRGFPNSRPSEGHFNGGGHRLIAKAIYKAVAMRIDGRFSAFHAN